MARSPKGPQPKWKTYKLRPELVIEREWTFDPEAPVFADLPKEAQQWLEDALRLPCK